MGETLEKIKLPGSPSSLPVSIPSPHSTPTLGPPPPFPSLKALK